MSKTPRLLTLLAIVGLMLMPIAGFGALDAEERIASRSRVEDHGFQVANRNHILTQGAAARAA